MPKYVLYLDRRVWSNGTLVVEVESVDQALQLYQQGLLEDQIDDVSWDDDDVKISIVGVEETEVAF
jgi:hypothetical protein